MSTTTQNVIRVATRAYRRPGGCATGTLTYIHINCTCRIASTLMGTYDNLDDAKSKATELTAGTGATYRECSKSNPLHTAARAAEERAERRQQLADSSGANAYELAVAAVRQVVRELPKAGALRVRVTEGSPEATLTRDDLHALAYSGHTTADAVARVRAAVTAHIRHGERAVHEMFPASGVRPALYLPDILALLRRWDDAQAEAEQVKDAEGPHAAAPASETEAAAPTATDTAQPHGLSAGAHRVVNTGESVDRSGSAYAFKCLSCCQRARLVEFQRDLRCTETAELEQSAGLAQALLDDVMLKGATTFEVNDGDVVTRASRAEVEQYVTRALFHGATHRWYTNGLRLSRNGVPVATIRPAAGPVFRPGERIVCADGVTRTVADMAPAVTGEPACVIVEDGAEWIAENCRPAVESIVARMRPDPSALTLLRAKAAADREAYRARMDERQAAEHRAHGVPVPAAVQARIDARAEQAPERRVIEGVVVQHAGTAKGSTPDDANHPNVIAARAALDGLAAATLTDHHDVTDPTDDELDVRGYMVAPREGDRVAVYWLEAGRIIRRDDSVHGPALDCLADRLARRGWRVEKMLRSSRCVFAHRPQ